MQRPFKVDLQLNDSEVFQRYYFDGEDEAVKNLYNFSNINIFIGANNSGKSFFAREILALKEYKGATNFLRLIELLDEFNEEIRKHSKAIQISSALPLNIKRIINRNRGSFTPNLPKSLKYDNFIIFSERLEENKRVLEKCLSEYIRLSEIKDLDVHKETIEIQWKKCRHINLLLQEITNHQILNRQSNAIDKIYVPSLRTAHSLFRHNEDDSGFNKIKEDILKVTVKKNYSLYKKKDIDISTGMDIYNQIVNARNGEKDERRKFEEFESFIATNFFDEDGIDIVARLNIYEKNEQKDDQELINIYLNKEPRNLYEIGDGIQALIIIMYNVFMAKEGSLIFIDEPELNLHPGMQRLFLDTIVKNETLLEKDFIYIIATHSNHFLDLTIEQNNISVYNFSKELNTEGNKLVIKNVNSGDNSVLRGLGVHNSSVFLANCSIWVEGISDRIILKAALLAYYKFKGEEFPKEDIEFTFIEYAGSNLVHYDFTEEMNNEANEGLKSQIKSIAISNNILLIADLDSGKEAKHDYYNNLSSSIEGFSYINTAPAREIENLLSKRIRKKVLGNFMNKRKIEYINLEFQTSINETVDQYSLSPDNYIGAFLNKVQKKIPQLRTIWAKNGSRNMSLTVKGEFSNYILTQAEKEKITWDDFKDDETLVEIIENMYEFIKSNNHN